MGGDRARQTDEVVAAFEERHDPPVGGLIGNLHQLLRRPGEIRLGEVEVRERVAHMSVEAGGDDDKPRAEVAQPRQDHVLQRGAKFAAAVASFVLEAAIAARTAIAVPDFFSNSTRWQD